MKHNWISNSFLCHPLRPCTPSSNAHSIPPAGALVIGGSRSRRGRYFCSSAQSAQQNPPSRAADKVPKFDPRTCMHTYETGPIRRIYVVRSQQIKNVTPPCVSSVSEKKLTNHIDEQLFDAMLFLSDHRTKAATHSGALCYYSQTESPSRQLHTTAN